LRQQIFSILSNLFVRDRHETAQTGCFLLAAYVRIVSTHHPSANEIQPFQMKKRHVAAGMKLERIAFHVQDLTRRTNDRQSLQGYRSPGRIMPFSIRCTCLLNASG
jgi:hypothetical protein